MNKKMATKICIITFIAMLLSVTCYSISFADVDTGAYSNIYSGVDETTKQKVQNIGNPFVGIVQVVGRRNCSNNANMDRCKIHNGICR